MKRIFALSVFFALFSACDTANNQHPSVQYEEKKASLKDIETSSPLKFLKVKGSFRGNLVNQTVVEGVITNNATLVSYKNIQLQIIFRDSDGAVIDKQKEVLDNVIRPGATDNFKIKMGHVKGANAVSVDITSAVAD